MYGLSVDANWCPDGVELIEELSVTPSGATIAGGTVAPGAPQTPGRLVFRHRTDRRDHVHYEHKSLEKLIVLEFLNARDDERRLEFFKSYGLTLPLGDILGYEPRDQVAHNQDQLRLLLQNANVSPAMAIMTANNIIGATRGAGLLPEWHLAGQRGAPRVTLKAASLLIFMMMEASMAIAHGAQLATCEQCGTYFLVGKATSRRASARFCSDRCRVAAMRARQAAAMGG